MKTSPDQEENSSLAKKNSSSLDVPEDENSPLIDRQDQEQALAPKNKQSPPNEPTAEESNTSSPMKAVAITAFVLLAFMLNPILGLLSILAIGAVAVANANKDKQEYTNQVGRANEQLRDSNQADFGRENSNQQRNPSSQSQQQSNPSSQSRQQSNPRPQPKGRFVSDEEKAALDLLGLKDNPSPSVQDVNKAYKKASLKYHPDRNKDPDATATFQNIASARDYLMPIAEMNDAARPQSKTAQSQNSETQAQSQNSETQAKAQNSETQASEAADPSLGDTNMKSSAADTHISKPVEQTTPISDTPSEKYSNSMGID